MDTVSKRRDRESMGKILRKQGVKVYLKEGFQGFPEG